MPGLATDLWSLTSGRPEVDPSDLAAAVQEEANRERLDYRTRLLIRDSVTALRNHWGEQKFAAGLEGCPARVQIEAISREHFDRPGFSVEERLVEKTDPAGAEKLFEKACDLMDGLGCDRLARIRTSPTLFASARKYYQRECDGLDPDSCANLAKRRGVALCREHRDIVVQHLPSDLERRHQIRVLRPV